MKKILHWFGKPNDWHPVWFENAYWDITTDFGILIKICAYEIIYSPIRHMYKIKCNGHNPKRHKFYGVAVAKLNELIDGEAMVRQANKIIKH